MPRGAHAGPPPLLPEESAGTPEPRFNGKKQALMREINKRLMKVGWWWWCGAGRRGKGRGGERVKWGGGGGGELSKV